MSIQPTIEDIYQAVDRLDGVAVKTPLIPLGSREESSILLKLEIHQPINSFKIRGVFNAVAQLDPEQRQAGLSCTSAGNTAQALAWCGRYFDVEARAIMPEHAPVTKIAAVEAYGGTPVLVPREEVFSFMQNRGWENEPYSFIHAWHDRGVLAGHGTAGIEIIEQCPDIESLFIPVGGGGLLIGVATAVKALKPDVRIVAVEPETCPALSESLAINGPASVECNTFCDGVAVPFITPEVFPVIKDLVDDVRLISEEDARQAIRLLADQNKIITEGAGALAVAAALQIPLQDRGKSVCIVSGGSIDPARLLDILSASDSG